VPQGPISRREFARYLSGIAMGAGASWPFALQLGAIGSASAQAASSYKALVCIFMFGGNDAHNMILATDNDSWGRYFSARNSGVDPIALMPLGTAPAALGSTSGFNGRTVSAATPEYWGGVVPISLSTPQLVPQGTNATSRNFAVHPMLAPLVPLFSAGRLAMLANVGTLVQPTTKAQYSSGGWALPSKLFSHNDQQSEWQAGAAEGARYGWGGQLADIVLSNNANANYTSISTGGNAVFLSGRQGLQYPISTGATPAIAIKGAGLNTKLMGSAIAGARFTDIIGDTSLINYFASDHASVVKTSMDAAGMINASMATSQVEGMLTPPNFVNPLTGAVDVNPLLDQLAAVARVIAANSALGMKRQVFFVSYGSFDTHLNENAQHPVLMAQLAQALCYFDGALSNIGGIDMRPNVTAFTASDFCRTFNTNGQGTDHAWGSHHLIWGGSVKGGKIYGQYPTLGIDSGSFQNPDMAGAALIPSISVDQYAATLGQWFGASNSNLTTIFPNLENFGVRNLGFV
jgi:uncharacterized protein (DUF1501 family)